MLNLMRRLAAFVIVHKIWQCASNLNMDQFDDKICLQNLGTTAVGIGQNEVQFGGKYDKICV